MQKPHNGDNIAVGASLQNKHKVHITGEGYLSQVKQVEGFEDESEYNIRKQISQPMTIQITSVILDNLNRWTTAQGTVKKVDFKDQTKNKEFEKVLDQVWKGQSFNTFINTFYKEAIYTEFNGFVLVTKPKILEGGFIERDGFIEKAKDGNLDPYIIFISIKDIHDYLLNGDKVEYVIIKLGDERYRLIDDSRDVIFKKNGTKLIIESEVINEIGYVPARMISSINKNLLSSQVKTSPIDHIIPALDRFFSSDADLRIQFIRHNYPKLAIVTKECTACNSTGKVPEILKDGQLDTGTMVSCNVCNGTGKIIPISRGGVIGLPQYLASGDSAYPGSPASYITPDTDSLRLGLEDLVSQKESIIYSGTGDKNLISESLNTATENMINSRSLEDRIKEITQMVEAFEVFVKQAIKDLHKSFASISDYFIVVRYGKRISLKNEDELLQEIKLSKEAGLSFSYIQALQRDLIYSKYKNNVQELDRQLLLVSVEPLSGYTAKEALEAASYLNDRDLYVKLNFDSIISEIETKTPLLYFMPDADWGEKIIAINKQINEIFQRRSRERDPDRSKEVGDPNEDRTQNS